MGRKAGGRGQRARVIIRLGDCKGSEGLLLLLHTWALSREAGKAKIADDDLIIKKAKRKTPHSPQTMLTLGLLLSPPVSLAPQAEYGLAEAIPRPGPAGSRSVQEAGTASQRAARTRRDSAPPPDLEPGEVGSWGGSSRTPGTECLGEVSWGVSRLHPPTCPQREPAHIFYLLPR